MEEVMKGTGPHIRVVTMIFAILLGMVVGAASSSAQKDTFGEPDICRIVVMQDEKSNQVMASVSVLNDEELAALTLPFRYGNGKSPIKVDSVIFWKTRSEYFDMKTQLLDTVRQTILIGLIADMSGSRPPMKKGDGEVARIYFTIDKSKKFEDVLMDTTIVKPFNVLKFVTPDVKGVYPEFDNSQALIKGGIPMVSSKEEGKESKAEEPQEKKVEEKD
jgi:hypothetical protein